MDLLRTEAWLKLVVVKRVVQILVCLFLKDGADVTTAMSLTTSPTNGQCP